MKAVLKLQCSLALLICRPYPKPSSKLETMNEPCSPHHTSPENISRQLSIDLLIHRAQSLSLPLFQHVLKFAKPPQFSSTSSPALAWSHPPTQMDYCPSEPLSLKQRLELRIAPVMGKGSSHVKCDSQWRPCLGPQGSQQHPSPCCPAVSHIRNPVASLGNYAAPVEL